MASAQTTGLFLSYDLDDSGLAYRMTPFLLPDPFVGRDYGTDPGINQCRGRKQNEESDPRIPVSASFPFPKAGSTKGLRHHSVFHHVTLTVLPIFSLRQVRPWQRTD